MGSKGLLIAFFVSLFISGSACGNLEETIVDNISYSDNSENVASDVDGGLSESSRCESAESSVDSNVEECMSAPLQQESNIWTKLDDINRHMFRDSDTSYARYFKDFRSYMSAKFSLLDLCIIALSFSFGWGLSYARTL